MWQTRNTAPSWEQMELERYQAEERQRWEDERRERERQAQIRKEEREERLRYAETWKEALSKQAYLMDREQNAVFFGDPLYDDEDTYFSSGADACRRALEIWKEEEVEAKGAIAELQARIQAIKDQIRVNVGKKLAEESDLDGWQSVASALYGDEYEGPSDWLYW